MLIFFTDTQIHILDIMYMYIISSAGPLTPTALGPPSPLESIAEENGSTKQKLAAKTNRWVYIGFTSTLISRDQLAENHSLITLLDGHPTLSLSSSNK